MGTVTADPWKRRCVIFILVLIVGAYYRWAARVANGKFEFGYDLDGFYDYLGQAFAHGHLYLPVEPSRSGRPRARKNTAAERQK